MLSEDNQALWDVVRVALASMMFVQILGIYWNVLYPRNTVQLVECSIEIVNMARKLNVTLLGSCEVVQS